MRIRKVGIIGAGIMGHGIAALAASTGIPVVLLDIPGSDDPRSPDRNAPAKNALAKGLKARPSPFFDTAAAALITTGNTADHLDLLKDCDWICEAIIEQPKPKQELFAKLEPLAPNAIISSNTSGIPMATLLEGRSASFKERFLGTHYFNPVRYMHLLEIIPSPHTASAVIESVRHLQERLLGKGIVLCKDVPGFVANRLGIGGWAAVMRLMMEFDLTIDEVDGLTGALLARARSATFRTGDLSGLDTLAHVTAGLSHATGEDFALPSWVGDLVKSGRLGDKTGAGFYRKDGKNIFPLDWKTGDYEPQKRLTTPAIEEALKLPAAERIRKARGIRGKYGDFLRKLFVETSHYAATRAPELAYDIASVDRAMEWGFAWEIGPFKVMDALGISWLRNEFTAAGRDAPPLFEAAGNAFYKEMKKGVMIPSLAAFTTLAPPSEIAALSSAARAPARVPLPKIPGQIVLAETPVLDENAEARLRDVGDGVLCLEFCGKMNTLGQGVLELLARAMDRVARDNLAGLVLGNDDPRTFTAGANLGGVAQLAAAGDWATLERACREFQRSVMSVRTAPFPVVAAPFGVTFGGGTEFSLHADRIQAHAELYMGLVEVGVGILPSGGGTKELLFRFTSALAPYEDADPFDAARRAFKLIALAQTSTSAHEARKIGFLRPVADRITMNRDFLIADAKAQVLNLATDYVAPPLRTIRALGAETLGNLKYALFAFQEAGQASAHDVRIGQEIAYVLAGGDGPPRDVSEQDILDLEREAFLKLLGTAETQARIKYMLEMGKPLRN